MTPLEDVPTIITSITSKRADMTILEEPVAMGVVQTNPNLTYIKLENGFNVNDKDIEVAIAVGKGNSELNTLISNFLNTLTDEERTNIMETAIAKNAE